LLEAGVEKIEETSSDNGAFTNVERPAAEGSPAAGDTWGRSEG